MMQKMSGIQQSFQKETVSKMAQKFENLMQNMLYLSSQEENLKSDVDRTYRNSPRLKELAAKQQILQDQLQSITSQMMALSKETFAITPEIGKGIGKANYGMQQAKEKLLSTVFLYRRTIMKHFPFTILDSPSRHLEEHPSFFMILGCGRQ